jgi:pyruvate,water dikinase
LGYAPAFLLARGVVAGWGSPFCAAGHVLRKLGICAVTNLELARYRGKTGDRVELDGDAGTLAMLS